VETKFVPLTVNVCVAAPAMAEEGERPVTLGTGFNVGGVEELPPPPPPQDIKIAKVSATRIEVTTRRVTGVLENRTFVSCDTVGYLLLDFLGPKVTGPCQRSGVDPTGAD
jgi:hypothetical protein